MVSSGKPLSFLGSLLLGQILSFGLAVFYVWVQWLSLSPSDGAAGGSFLQVVFDPFVLSVMIPTSFVVGILMTSIVHFAVTGRHYSRSIMIVVATSFAWVGITTPFSGSLALYGVLPSIGIAIVYCRVSKFTTPIPQGLSSRSA